MMFTVDEYRHELWREVTERAQDHDIYDQEAFFETACEILRDSEAIAAYHPAYTRYRMGTPQALAIDGYDQDAFEMDESIVVTNSRWPRMTHCRPYKATNANGISTPCAVSSSRR